MRLRGTVASCGKLGDRDICIHGIPVGDIRPPFAHQLRASVPGASQTPTRASQCGQPASDRSTEVASIRRSAPPPTCSRPGGRRGPGRLRPALEPGRRGNCGAVSISIRKGAIVSLWRTLYSLECFFATNALRQMLRAFVAKKHSPAWRRLCGKSGALPEGNQQALLALM